MEIYKFGRDMLQSREVAVRQKLNDTSYPLHWHDYYEIIYYENCSGVCVVNTAERPICDRCLFLLTPRDFHSIETENRPDSRSVNISFSENAVDRKLLWDISQTPFVWYSPSDFTVSLIDRMNTVSRTEGSRSEFLSEKLLNVLLCDILREGNPISGINPYANSIIGKAMLFITSDLSRKITLKEIAAYCGMTPTYFSSLFHTETGKTFIGWLTDVRIDRAKYLLNETDASVLEISLDCGYGSFSHFIKIFRRNVGISPTAYRKQHIENSHKSG